MLVASIYSQEFAITVHNTAYINCPNNYEELENISSNDTNTSSQLFRDGKPFSGFSKITPEEGDEYFIYNAANSFIDRVTAYFKSGEISREFNFQNGKAHGLHIMYYKNGSKYIEEYYKNGTPMNIHRRWYDNQQLAKEAHFNMGMKISALQFNKDGTRKN